ncbi:MAG TPA: TerB family tellurite resistance protein [Vitreimonas sp.]|uniref:TerB family tellurite resistance protein n=1 Tax=Vitreimonas sp. TaxID=3069702 RepID=UPI002D3BC22A|nr:TerB family tellurite resistance protein [Vitreimonas sp.]HYD87491.1 TerB family tellurite resistance protein [Vitreimonas sp.]
MASGIVLLSSAAPVAPATAPKPQMEDAGGAAVALFLLVLLLGGWFALRTFVRTLRARKAQAAVGADFTAYALEALVNAAKIDGRISAEEKAAITRAMGELAPGFAGDRVEAAFGRARLSKDELVAYLAAKADAFSREQKLALLRALMSVFVADGKFDETEHHTLVDYTAAIGFDRPSALQTLRGLARDVQRGSIT